MGELAGTVSHVLYVPIDLKLAIITNNQGIYPLNSTFMLSTRNRSSTKRSRTNINSSPSFHELSVSNSRSSPALAAGNERVTKFIENLRDVTLDPTEMFVTMYGDNSIIINNKQRFVEWYAKQGGRATTAPDSRCVQ